MIGCAVKLCITTQCKRRKVVNIMWIMIIFLMVLNAVYALGMLEALSDADDQSERLVMEHGKDGRNV